jgi:hypothetical protein
MTNPNPTAVAGQPKDQNVLTFMMQLVQEKYSDDVDNEFLTGEANRLYDLFGDRLVSYFEPLLSNEQKKQFDQMVEQGNNQEMLLSFLIQAIPDLETKIMQILVNFRTEYISSGKEQQTAAAPL